MVLPTKAKAKKAFDAIDENQMFCPNLLKARDAILARV